MIRTIRAISMSCLILLLSAICFGQGGAATGDLHVTVKDAKGNLVTNATVTVRDVAKGLERTATSDGQGGYSAQLLPPGNYSVTVEARGFTKITNTGVAVTVGGLVELPVVLSVFGGKEIVEVTSQAELVETSRSSTTDTISQRRIDNLPINGRNYINFTLTDSQVVRDNAPNTGAAPTSGLNMSGQRARSNLVNVDGADATDNSVNGVRSTVSQEAVQEFQIITNSYAAEYGRAAGGVVNIITRSGSNDFHGDVFGFLRNRNLQAVNPFSTVANPAYTRVQAGVAFGGPIKKDRTFFYFAYEITRRHETGFSSIGQDCSTSGGQTCFGLSPFDASALFGAPAGLVNLQLTPDQTSFLSNPAVLGTMAVSPAYAGEVQQYAVLTGASSGQSVQGVWPSGLVEAITFGGLSSWAGFPTSCAPPGPCAPVPGSYQTLSSQTGNFPVFEGTSLYSLRIDHNINNNNRLTLRGNVSPSTVTGIEVSGQSQPVGQNAYSRTSEQTYRDVAGVLQDTWTIGANKVNEFRFQYARRGLSYFYNTKIPGGADPAVNIPGFAYFGREPYSYIQRVEQRYQFTDNFTWTVGRHNMKFGGDVNYLPLTATFTVNYGGVYDFGGFSAATLGFVAPTGLPAFPDLSPVQSYGAGLPGDFIQGIGSPSDKFKNIPIGAFWQDSWRVSPTVTLNYGVRYDVEIPPKFAAPQGLALPAYNLLGLQKGIQTDKNNFQPRIGLAWDPSGDGKTVVRASYGMFYDHPLLGLYFLGDASDGSSSGQLAFAGTGPCTGAGNPGNLNAIPIFQGLQGLPQCAPSPYPQANANLWLPARPATVSVSQFPAVCVPKPELPERRLNQSDVPAARIPALRISAGQELRLRVRAAGKHHAGTRPRLRIRSQSCLQLQRRTASEPSHQCEYDSRRLDGGKLPGCLLRRSIPSTDKSTDQNTSQPVHGQRMQSCWRSRRALRVQRPCSNELLPTGRAKSVDRRRRNRAACPRRWRQFRPDSTPTAIRRHRAIPAASPSATWTPTTPTAARSTTASLPTSASASATITNSWRRTPGHMPSTTLPTCNRR